MKNSSVYAMSVLYVVTGLTHFIHPQFFLTIMPVWVPFHQSMVIISGACEILFAFLLLFPLTRRIAAWLIIALLIAVFPANIQMAVNYFNESNPMLWIALLRLPLQLVLIGWAYHFTKQLSLRIKIKE